MNIINVMIKELKVQFRDKKAMSIMTLFPIVLILILGTAFSSSFKNTTTISNVKVCYSVEGEETLSSVFNDFTKEFNKLDVNFTKISSKEEGINKVKDNKYNIFINVNAQDKIIELYKNDRYNFEASLVENIMSIFVDKCNLSMELYKINPIETNKILRSKGRQQISYTSINTLNGKSVPRAKDYYAVTMITLIILYSSLTGAFSIRQEEYNNTKKRLFSSPIKKYEIFIGKILGLTLITSFQIIIVFLFSKYVIKTYWGNYIVLELIILLTLIIMSLSIGMTVAFILKNDAAISTSLNVIIPILVFLGGGYMPISFSEESLLMKITKISPIKWANDCLFKLIYAGDTSYVVKSITINLIIALILFMVSSLMFRKEEA